jgi:hypothetical protein
MESSCISPKEPFNFIINIAVHVTILFCFLSAFFILYVSNLSKEALNKEIKHNIDNSIGNLFDSLNADEKTQIKTSLQTLPLEQLSQYYNKPHETVAQHNTWLFRAVIGFNVVFALSIIIAIVSVSYVCDRCVPIKEILLENSIIFAFIGIVEYLFFTKIALNWVPTKPSTIVTSFYDSIKRTLSN